MTDLERVEHKLDMWITLMTALMAEKGIRVPAERPHLTLVHSASRAAVPGASLPRPRGRANLRSA